MSSSEKSSSAGARWDLFVPPGARPDQIQAFQGLAEAFGWVAAQRLMPSEGSSKTYFDAKSQAILNTKLRVLALKVEAADAARPLNAMGRNGAPTIRAAVAIGRKALVDVQGVAEHALGGAIAAIEGELPGLVIPFERGHVWTLAATCPSLSDVPWAALEGCDLSMTKKSGDEVHPSVGDILYKSAEELDLGRFDRRFVGAEQGLKEEAAAWAGKFVIAQQQLASDARLNL